MLDFKVLPHQREFINSTDRNTMLVAGYGSGKSYAGTLKTIAMKMMYPNKRVAYYLPTYSLIKDIAFDKFPEILSALGLSYKLNKSDKEIHIDRFGTIIFRSMDNPETIIGYEVAYSLIDEADTLQTDKMEKVYNKILGRNRSIPNAIVDAVSTPEGFKWLYNQAQAGHFKVIKARSYDNKFLSEDYIQQLREQYPPNLLKAYLEGEFVNLTSGTVYSYFKREKHHSDVIQNERDQLFIGQDFNIGGCVSIIHVLRDGKPIAVDEIISKDTYSIIDNINERYPRNVITIYPDASGNANKTNASRSDIQLLKDAGFRVIAPSKNGRVVDRVNAMNAMFNNDSYLVNTNRCKEYTKALEQQAYKNGEPEKFGGAATIDDFNDASGYYIVREFGLNKPSITQNKLSFA